MHPHPVVVEAKGDTRAAAGSAGFAFSHVYSDSMVLQREPHAASVWGWATPGSTVTVNIVADASVAASCIAATAVAWGDGAWRASLPPQPASTVPVNITATESNTGATIEISDVLFGDVFICSGRKCPLDARVALHCGSQALAGGCRKRARSSYVRFVFRTRPGGGWTESNMASSVTVPLNDPAAEAKLVAACVRVPPLARTLRTHARSRPHASHPPAHRLACFVSVSNTHVNRSRSNDNCIIINNNDDDGR